MIARLAHLTVAVATLFTLAACPKDEPGSAKDPKALPPDANPNNVVKVELAVPWGAKVACADLLDPVAVAAALAEETVELVDKTDKGEKEATSICGIKKTGKALTQKQQEKIMEDVDFKLGIQPGDEICELKSFCSYPYDMAEARKSMEAQGQICRTDEIGDLTCVWKVQAGAEYRHIVTVLDPDSRCRLVVSPVSSTDENLMKACAKVFADQISSANLKVRAQ